MKNKSTQIGSISSLYGMKLKSTLLILMKVYLFLCVTVILGMSPNRALSQKSIVVEKDRIMTVDEVFDLIMEQTDYNFVYQVDMFKDYPKITLKKGNVRIDHILKQSLHDAYVNLEVVNNTIFIKDGKNAPPEAIRNEVAQQGTQVSGTVTDGTGAPLPGVNIVVQGTAIGTTTDFDGNFKILVPSDGSSLIFSYLGFKDEIVPVGNRTTIDVRLQESADALDEIVVVGYGTVKKKDLTGAVVSLGEDEMTLGASTSSAAQMIQGRAAGVEISANDGEPGQGLNIVIRGATSLSNSNEPLFVVDGFPLAPGVSISPEDIETIDILKDAASAAIYGSRGSAGVILITTKTGKSGKTEISYDGYTGVQTLMGDVEYLDWADFTRVRNEQYFEGPNDGNPWYNIEDINSPFNTNWLEEATRNAIVQSHTLRASGGNEDSHFAVSGSYFDQEGVFLDSEFTRASIRLNADHKFGERTKVGVNIYTSKIAADAMDKNPGSRLYAPLYSLLRAERGRDAYNDDGTYAVTPLSRDTQPFINPIARFVERINDYEEWRTYSNLYITHDLTSSLTGKINLGFDHTAGTRGQYHPVPYGTDLSMAYGSINEVKTTSYLVEGTLNYKFDMLGEKHGLDFLLGGSTQYDKLFTFSAVGTNFPTDKISYYNLGSASNRDISSYQEDKKIFSFFGRANYSYDGRFLLSATLRADGASQFGENNKWGAFPSVAAAWRISEEGFMQDSKWVSNLKLRASYGLTGNNNFSPYTSLARVGASNTFTYDGNGILTGLGTDGIFAPNPNLQWETTKMLNLGLDFGFWNERLYGTIEVYNSDTDNLIIDKPISSPSTGYQLIRANVGSMSNKGLEVALGSRVIDGENFKWNMNVNFATNKNEIKELDGDNPINIAVPRQPYGEIGAETYRQLKAGGEIGNFYGYTYRGVLKEGEAYAPQPNTTQAGSALFEDINGDGIVDTDDRSVIGNANPDFTLGLNNHFEYKGIYLDMFWQAVVGNDIFNFKAINMDRLHSIKAADRYSAANPSGTRPGVNYFANGYGSYVNTEFIEDGSYARLKNLTLGYNLNVDKLPLFSNINIYVQGQNLITLTGYSGFDPEVSYNYPGTQSSINRGVDDYGVPNFRTYTLGLKLTF